MRRSRLPDAVPPDNLSKSYGERGHEPNGDDYQAPDTATPDFAIPKSNAAHAGPKSEADAPTFVRAPETAPAFARVVIETDDDDNDDEEDDARDITGNHLDVPYPVLIVIGVLLIALAAYVATRNNEPAGLPDCASQPEWNQYNCQKY